MPSVTLQGILGGCQVRGCTGPEAGRPQGSHQPRLEQKCSKESVCAVTPPGQALSRILPAGHLV